MMYFFNQIEKIHHRTVPDEMEYIKNTGLFNQVTDQQFHQMLQTIRLQKYPAGKIIFHEGDQADGLYIVMAGSVRVFTIDGQQKKIPLARLNKGDYFGEQAIIKQGSKTRNASIEAVEDTTLILIKSESVIPLWEEDQHLKKKLQKIGYEQALQTLAATIKVYADLKPLIEQIENPVLVDLPDGEIIFNFGDESKHAYLILQGKAELIFPIKEKKEKHLTLHKGHLFGELGILEQKPRSATAIARDSLRVLMIDSDQFRKSYAENAALKDLLTSLKQIYQLPLEGVVQQFVGSNAEIGSTVTSIFNMDDGRSIIAVRSLHQNIFTMSVIDAPVSIDHKYIRSESYFTTLKVANHRLIGIASCGDWEGLRTACKLLLDHAVITDSVIRHFLATGEIAVGVGKKNIICTCMSVKTSEIQALMDAGMLDFESLSKETGAGSVCGSCQYKILEMLGENPWLTAILTKTIQHNHYINSYEITPVNSKFKSFEPGQYVVIQAKISNNWIERAYTISGQVGDGLRVSIKKEANGLFTQWLFDQGSHHIPVNVAQPHGFFLLNKDEQIPALCFAGGIGITPFMMFAKGLVHQHLHKKIHILYCALTENDFIFMEEFGEIIQKLPTITVSYRGTDQHGLLTENEIKNLIQSLQAPEVYICGPEGFESLICKTLHQMKYDPHKIHIEKFVYAGMKETA